MIDRRERILSDDHLALAEQALLNLAVNGFQIISKTGSNLTALLLAQADRINQQYDQALRRSTPAKRTPRKATAPAGPPKLVRS